jgi:predicted Zn-dependent protease
MLEFFEDMQAGAAAGEEDWAAFLSSHPLTEVRLAYLTELLEEYSRHTSPRSRITPTSPIRCIRSATRLRPGVLPSREIGPIMTLRS